MLAVLVPFVSSLALAGAPASATPPRLSQARAEALVRDVSAAVEHIRGLRFKRPVAVVLLDGKQARADFEAKVDPWDRQDIHHLQDAYTQLGLIPAGTDLLSGYLDVTEKEVDGYYKPGTDTFFLLDHVEPLQVRMVMAHELTHALEDQNYDLKALAKEAGGDADRALALTALIEGSAMTVMMSYAAMEHEQDPAEESLQRTETRRAERLRLAPSFTQRSLMLPYLLGVTFLLRGRPWDTGWSGGVQLADLDKAYHEPPRSSREILHPEEYWLRLGGPEPPLQLPDLSAALGPGWTRVTEGSVGELGVAALTGSNESVELPAAFLPARWTNPAAAGVVADQFQHYVNGERRVTVMVTRWETTRDADAYVQALKHRGRATLAYGVNVLTIAGDIGDRVQPVASAALQQAAYWFRR